MRPFQIGTFTRDAYKAMVLQLDPNDGEAEHVIRRTLEQQNERRIRTG